MSNYNKNNKFISYLIILIILFVLILSTKDQVLLLQENIDLKETASFNLTEQKNKLTTLNELKKDLNNSSENYSKYYIKIKEDEFINYIYSYVEKINSEKGLIILKNISISEPKETEIGFNETRINLNITVDNELKLKKFLDFLTSEKSKYKFYIESFNYPYGEDNGSMNVSIPLKILHK